MTQDQESKAPHIAVSAQYIKDISFENPNAPAILATHNKQPNIDLSLDLKTKKMPEEDHYEVEISITAKVIVEEDILFLIDLKYAGVFHLINIPQEQVEIMLAVHCPAIIFPYARRIISNTTQDGGFYPLSIDPVDFGMLYSKKMMENENAAKS